MRLGRWSRRIPWSAGRPLYGAAFTLLLLTGVAAIALSLIDAPWTRALEMIDAGVGKQMLHTTIGDPGRKDADHDPALPWRSTLRSWIYTAVGYDPVAPKSFLLGQVAHFDNAVRRTLDVVHVPEREQDPVDSSASASSPEAEGVPGVTDLEGSQLSPDSPDSPDSPGMPDRTEPGMPDRTESMDLARSLDLEDSGPSTGTDPASQPSESPDAAQGAPMPFLALSRMNWGPDPLVLIYHSHTSESYHTVPKDPRMDSSYHIMNDSDTGITRVGKAMAERLQEYGIGVVHSTRVHNFPHHWEAYVNSRRTVLQLLDEYPSIKMILDVHRQGIPDVVWATTVSGQESTKVEIIYTTANEMKYGEHPDWKENERLALSLAEKMRQMHPGLLQRVTTVHNKRYNQDLFPGMLLLEVGNYLDDEARAIVAGRFTADAVAATLAEMLVGSP